MKKIKILLDENKRIISYCDFGELKNSIEVEVEDNFYFKNGINNYMYLNEKIEYTVDLEKLKKFKRNELKYFRDKELRKNISLYGVEFQIRNEIDIENFKDIERGVNKGYKKLEEKTMWILADNSIKEFTNEQLVKVLDENGLRKEKIFIKYSILCNILKEAKTVEEIESIKWE